MSCEVSSSTNSSRIQHNIKELEEKRTSERKKHLLYLIHSYLFENGFSVTAEMLTTEAQLSNNIEVCDNVDLDIVLQEYTSYYYMKFKKYPKLCKKAVQDDTVTGKSSRNSTRSATKSSAHLKSAKKTNSLSVPLQPTPPAFTVTPIFSNAYSENSLQTICDEKEDAMKPLYDFPGYNSEWRELADSVSKDIITKDLFISWEDVKGLQNAKCILKEALLYPQQFPQLFSKIPVPWKGLLLYGPPGTGKTLLAKAVASECKSMKFFNMSASSLVSKWRGESEKLVRVLFDLAKYQEPSTIFIDEIDALASTRDGCQHDATRRFKSELLIQMDGIITEENRVFVLATSNVPWEIDPAILRRFEKRILVDYPNVKTRKEIFKYNLSKMTEVSKMTETNYDLFAKSTEGYTGADIRLVCKEAVMIPIREVLKEGNKTQNCQVSIDNVIEAIRNTKPSTKYLANSYYDWDKQFSNSN